jgi:hypothetical protein
VAIAKRFWRPQSRSEIHAFEDTWEWSIDLAMLMDLDTLQIAFDKLKIDGF